VTVRIGIAVRGIVQGVGFRPFVYGAARARGLVGWVRNDPAGVRIEIQGHGPGVRDFIDALRREAPAAAKVENVEVVELAPSDDLEFRIVDSDAGGAAEPCLPADLAICEACAREIDAARERRFRYPFTNCTHCGPRYSIIEALPYDRPSTSMRAFALCERCREEYGDPTNRRFHAQPIACPECGPRLRLLDTRGAVELEGDAALAAAAARIRSGSIVAVKGLGGFHLVADATDATVIGRLRQRKRRDEKPFAVMFPAIAAIRRACVVSENEAALLASPAAPIVLLRRRVEPSALAIDAIAPRNPDLGVLLPYTPLHHLLLAEVGRPVVCTSGNLSDEPLVVDVGDALRRLDGVADAFLDHDRPIVRPLDDSVARVVAGRPMLLRRARGFAPLPLALPAPVPCLLAVGGHLKCTVALARSRQVVASQHLGDLGSFEGTALLERTVTDLVGFFAAAPEAVACDLHPEYASTRLAERLAAAWKVPLVRVQHHHAHVAAVVAEHALRGPVLGLAWDGAGLGTDGVLWGGEALVVEGDRYRRVAHLRPFRLPGGERAMREPRRAALGMLFEIFGERALERMGSAFEIAEQQPLLAMLAREVNAPATTSIGRLFDAVAALAGIRARASFEGQAAMECEFAARRAGSQDAYPLLLTGADPWIADWEPMLHRLLRDRAEGVSAELVAARFHGALVALAEQIATRTGVGQIVLSGGCFQNAVLATRVIERLESRGFAVHVPERYPPNDGGLALGQIWVAAHHWNKEEHRVSRHSG